MIWIETGLQEPDEQILTAAQRAAAQVIHIPALSVQPISCSIDFSLYQNFFIGSPRAVSFAKPLLLNIFKSNPSSNTFPKGAPLFLTAGKTTALTLHAFFQQNNILTIPIALKQNIEQNKNDFSTPLNTTATLPKIFFLDSSLLNPTHLNSDKTLSKNHLKKQSDKNFGAEHLFDYITSICDGSFPIQKIIWISAQETAADLKKLSTKFQTEILHCPVYQTKPNENLKLKLQNIESPRHWILRSGKGVQALAPFFKANDEFQAIGKSAEQALSDLQLV